jgi:hypothetical protein
VSNYTKQVNFTEKDSKPLTDPGKVIKGSEFDSEFNLVAGAIASKADANNSALTGNTSVASLTLGGVAVTATAAELNSVAGSGLTSTDVDLLTNAGSNTGTQLVTTDGTQTLQNKTISGGALTGSGSVNDCTVGNLVPSTGSFTTLDADSFTVGTSNELTVTTNGRLNSSTYIAANEFRIGATPIVDSNRDASFNSLVLGSNDAVTAVPQYESNTFTPTLFSGATQQSAGSATGTYIAVGDMVTVFITLTNIDTTGATGTQSVEIKSLPFNCAIRAGGYYTGTAWCSNIVNPSGVDNGHFIPLINAGTETDTIALFATVNNSGQPETMIWNDVNDDTADIHITLTYQKA